METFQLLFLKIIPLYTLILLGFLCAKKLHLDKDTIGRLLLYVISPVIVFYGGLLNNITIENISLPVIVFLIAGCVSLLFYRLGQYFFPNSSDANLLAYSAGASNTGYFGLPVIASILGQEAFTLAIIANLGMIIFENTLGFYLAAKGNFSAKQSLIKIAQLPHLYVLSLGILFNLLGFSKNQILLQNFEYFKGAYALLGMMIIGIGLANMRFVLHDFKFVGLSFLAKFICFPLITLLFIWIDQTMKLCSPTSHQVLLIILSTPLAANAVVIAGELKLNPAKAALGVLTTTLFAILFIPLIIQVL